MNYKKQGKDFIKKYNTIISIDKAPVQKVPLWAKDGDNYGICYNVTIKRENKKEFSFNFWDSIHNKEMLELSEKRIGLNNSIIFNGKRYFHKDIYAIQKQAKNGEFNPDEYIILACLTKNETGDFEDFCSEYGCNKDSLNINKVYQAVVKEWFNVSRIFGDCLEELREIN